MMKEKKIKTATKQNRNNSGQKSEAERIQEWRDSRKPLEKPGGRKRTKDL